MLTLTHLVKHYGTNKAVDGLSLSVGKGEVFGLLGPNGAGKSTTVHMAVGIVEPTSGTVDVGGLGSPSRPAVRARIGVAPQALSLYELLSGEENLAFFAKLYGVPRAERRQAVAYALEVVGLTARSDDRVETYSGGMRRRLNLGCALVSTPRVVLLDEPTVAVDPQSRAHIFDAVRALRARGTTILYTTHQLREAEDLCDRIAIMDEGLVVACGTLVELLERSRANEIIELRLLEPLETLAPIQALDGVRAVESIGHELRVFTTRAQQVLPRIYRAVSTLGHSVVRTRVTPVTLDDVFLDLTGKELRD